MLLTWLILFFKLLVPSSLFGSAFFSKVENGLLTDRVAPDLSDSPGSLAPNSDSGSVCGGVDLLFLRIVLPVSKVAHHYADSWISLAPSSACDSA